MAIADTYDALTSDRPYRKALSALETRKLMLTSSGNVFDPQLLELFFDLIGRKNSAMEETRDGK